MIAPLSPELVEALRELGAAAVAALLAWLHGHRTGKKKR